jgi:hypothetical protein
MIDGIGRAIKYCAELLISLGCPLRSHKEHGGKAYIDNTF